MEAKETNRISVGTSDKRKMPRSEKKRLKRMEKILNKRETRKEKKLMKKEKTGANDILDACDYSPIDSDVTSNDVESAVSAMHSTTNLKRKGEEATDISRKAISSDIKHIPKKMKVELIRQRCKEALISGLKVCIDCSLEKHMTEKECNKLAQQIGRLYGSNRNSEKPVHIYLTGLDKNGEIYKQCVNKNAGFENYLLDTTAETVDIHFSNAKEKIVYLSPESDNVLSGVDPDKIYVIGGLVDETVKGKVSVQVAAEKCISSARLPIDEYMEKLEDGAPYSYNQILAVNQVFDILLTLNETDNDWKKALNAGVPKRKGFVLKEETNVKLD